MTRWTQKLFFLLGALSIATAASGPAALRESSSRNVAGLDQVKAWRDMLQGANLRADETTEREEQRATERRGPTLKKLLFEGGDATVQEEGIGVLRRLVAPQTTDANLRAESVKLEASRGALQRRGAVIAASSVAADASNPSPPPPAGPSEGVLHTSKREARSVTNEVLTALSAALLGAALGGGLGEMQQLINQGADIGYRNTNGYTALHWAAANDQLEAMRLLIDRGANVNSANNYATTPLHIAASKDSVNLVEALLRARANMAARDQWGRTPLHAAYNFNREGVVRTLLRAGADPNIRDKEGKMAKDLGKGVAVRITAAHEPSTFTQRHATVEAPPPRLSPEEERRALSEKLLEAATNGDVDEMRQLIAKGADVSYKNRYGATALHLAAQEGHVDGVRLLLGRGAAVDAATDSGTALHLAAWNGHAQSVGALAEAGANLNAQDKQGRTPLYDAALQNKEATVRALLTRGADRDIKNNEGKTALDVASSYVVRQLLMIIGTVDRTVDKFTGLLTGILKTTLG